MHVALITRHFRDHNRKENNISVGTCGTLSADVYSYTNNKLPGGDVIIPSGSMILVTALVADGEWIEVLALERQWLTHHTSLETCLVICCTTCTD
jgi:hypothetical protein